MYDVVIVGGGPVGLFLACELGLAGCSVLILERDTEPGNPYKAFPLGMRGLSAASTAAFYRRGMLEALLAASGAENTDPEGERSRPAGGGHFGGMIIDPDRIDAARLPYWLPSPAPDGLRTSLETVESVLAERAAKLGVEIRRGVTVTGVDSDDTGVTARAGTSEYRGRWLVGCDGGRSAVRKLAGFDFAGTGPQLTGYSAIVDIADPEKLRYGFTLTPHGMYVRLPVPGHLGMMDFDGGAYDRARRPTAAHLQAVLRRISGTDVTLTGVRLAATFTDRTMQATAYRRGRVLLAGDAAHIHSPLGGQGLNLGIGDAVNLGWKLAATVRGDAPDGLLDTYTGERHPAGARVLDWSRAQVAVMRPDPHAQAIQGVLRDLIGTGDGTTYMFARISGTTVRYDLGDDHPLTGRVVPELRLRDGTRLGDLAHDGRALAVDLSAGGRLRSTAGRWESRMRYVAGAARDDLGLEAALVRPDGVVAWAADGPGADPEAFARAAARWLG